MQSGPRLRTLSPLRSTESIFTHRAIRRVYAPYTVGSNKEGMVKTTAIGKCFTIHSDKVSDPQDVGNNGGSTAADILSHTDGSVLHLVFPRCSS